MMKNLLCIFAFLLLASYTAKAQMEPTWQSKTGSRILWNKFAPNGNLICGTKDDGTVALDPYSGDVLWSINFNHGVFEILPNTPYIYYFIDEKELLVLDPENGNVLCNSGNLGMENIEAFYPVRAGNNFLVYTQMDDREQFWMVSLNSGELLWKQDMDLDKDVEIGGGFITVEENEEEKGLMCDPVGDNKGGVFLAVHDRLMHIDAQGEKSWDIEYPSMFGDQKGFFKAATVAYSRMFPDKSGENLYVFSGGYMTCHSAKDGSLSWEKPVKVTGPVRNLIFDEKGMILIPSSDDNAMKKHKLNLVDYKTGETLWGDKGTEFKGGFVQSQYCEQGIVFITKSYMNDAHYFNILNIEDGSLILNKSLKISSGPYTFEEVNGGLLFSSRQEANIYKYESQEFVAEKELKAGGDDFLLSTSKNNLVYFFNSSSSKIFEFDRNSLEMKAFHDEKIKLKGGDVAEGLDVFEDGLVLYAAQNLVKFDWDGNILYQQYYQAPGQGFLNVSGNVLGATFKVLGGLAQVAASYAAVAAVDELDNTAREGMHEADRLYEEQKGVDRDLVEYRENVAEYEQNMDEAKQLMNEEMQEMAAMGVLNAMDIQGNINAISKRFRNSKATKKYVLLMTDDKEQGGVGLAVVSKLDGGIKGFIPMKFSKENPSYTVDPFTNKLFWMPSLDSGKNSFGRYNDIEAMQNSGTVLSFDLNSL